MNIRNKLTVTLGVIGVCLATFAAAKPSERQIYRYYGDDSHRNQVGYKSQGCDSAQFVLFGTETEYFTYESYPCS